jgi:hypothetical protein
MKKAGVPILVVAIMMFMYLPVANASGLSGFSLGPSTGGILVAPDFSGVTGSLGVNFEDGCIAGQTSCSFSNITGSVLFGGLSVGSYFLDFNSTPFLANFNGPGSWLFSSGDTSGYGLTGGAGGISGTITWQSLNESLSGADSLTGLATFTGTGSFVGIGSGSTSITLNLNPLTCANLSSGTSCSLGGVSLDPPSPQGYATFGSGSFGGKSGGATPEPSSLILLGSGLLGLAPFVRRKISRT